MYEHNVSIDKVFIALNNGYLASRDSWEEYTFLFKQIPVIISASNVDSLKSLPQLLKDIIKYDRDTYIENNVELFDITSNSKLGRISPDYHIQDYQLTDEDFFADDWYIINSVT